MLGVPVAQCYLDRFRNAVPACEIRVRHYCMRMTSDTTSIRYKIASFLHVSSTVERIHLSIGCVWYCTAHSTSRSKMGLCMINADWTHRFGSSEKADKATRTPRASMTPPINVLPGHNPTHRCVWLDTLSRDLGLEPTQVYINTVLEKVQLSSTPLNQRPSRSTSVCHRPHPVSQYPEEAKV